MSLRPLLAIAVVPLLALSACESSAGTSPSSTDGQPSATSVGTPGSDPASMSTSGQTSEAYEVTTVVGEGEVGDGLDGVAVADDGTIYVSDFGGFEDNTPGTTVYKISPDGTSEVLTDALVRPLGLAVEPSGNVLVVHEGESGEGELASISPDGTVSVVAAVSGGGIALDDSGTIYVNGGETLYDGVDITTIPGFDPSAEDGGIDGFDPSLIEELGAVLRVADDGEVTTVASDERIGGPGIDIDADGNIVVAGYYGAAITSITPDGDVSVIAEIPEAIGLGPGGDEESALGGLIIVDDTIYTSSIGTGTIYQVDFDGTYSIVAGSGERTVVDGQGKQAAFAQPNRLAFDQATSTLYVSEYNKPALRSITFP